MAIGSTMRIQIATKCSYCQQYLTEYLDGSNPLLNASHNDQEIYLKHKHVPFCSFQTLKDYEVLKIDKRTINQLKYYIHKYELRDVYFDEIIRLIEDLFTSNNLHLYEKHSFSNSS